MAYRNNKIYQYINIFKLLTWKPGFQVRLVAVFLFSGQEFVNGAVCLLLDIL